MLDRPVQNVHDLDLQVRDQIRRYRGLVDAAEAAPTDARLWTQVAEAERALRRVGARVQDGMVCMRSGPVFSLDHAELIDTHSERAKCERVTGAALTSGREAQRAGRDDEATMAYMRVRELAANHHGALGAMFPKASWNLSSILVERGDTVGALRLLMPLDDGAARDDVDFQLRMAMLYLTYYEQTMAERAPGELAIEWRAGAPVVESEVVGILSRAVQASVRGLELATVYCENNDVDSRGAALRRLAAQCVVGSVSQAKVFCMDVQHAMVFDMLEAMRQRAVERGLMTPEEGAAKKLQPPKPAFEGVRGSAERLRSAIDPEDDYYMGWMTWLQTQHGALDGYVPRALWLECLLVASEGGA